jgi:hypothetical protein
MFVFLALLAFVLVLAYFLRQRQDEAWQRFRRRRTERTSRLPEQPDNPPFTIEGFPEQ